MKALYGKKIGMTQVFNESGTLIPVTVLHIEPNIIVAERTIEKNGYESKLLGVFVNKPSRFTKAYKGIFKNSISPRKKLFEIRGYKDQEIGKELGVEVFELTKYVDVTSTSKGKGHQGVMKRFHAKGGPGAHGSKFHRTVGSTGHSSNPARVRKGTHMSGRMGNEKVTIQNLAIIELHKEDNVLLIKGAVPGPIGSSVLIRESIKKVFN